MVKVAILGANGFIGGRTVEMLHLGDLAEVHPVVRNFAGLARLSRFDLPHRIADAFDEKALCAAFAGCDVVVHAIAGDRRTILGTLAPAYHAAERAGVRRLIYLSTASVHGQAPAPGTDESSALNARQVLPYNNAKVEAEKKLRKLHDQGTVELVTLRPGIVWGPRSVWVTNFVEALGSGNAYLLDQGRGICNSIYIDNLVHAIYLAMDAPDVDGGIYLVGDEEQITWADLYRPLAQACGYDVRDIVNVTEPEFTYRWSDRIKAVHRSRAMQSFLSMFPMRWRKAAYVGLMELLHVEEQPLAIASSTPVVTEEMALLYQCRYKLPFTKAKAELGYNPPIAFEEACGRTTEWLTFAGYPVA